VVLEDVKDLEQLERAPRVLKALLFTKKTDTPPGMRP
jgi:hypothetical protein